MPPVQAISVSRRGAAPSHCAAFADRSTGPATASTKGPTRTPSRRLGRRRERGSPPLPGDVEAARKANGATNVAVIEAAMEALSAAPSS